MNSKFHAIWCEVVVATICGRRIFMSEFQFRKKFYGKFGFANARRDEGPVVFAYI